MPIFTLECSYSVEVVMMARDERVSAFAILNIK